MADRYWVLGTGTWDATTTTNWSTSSGGAGGASVPTASDNVFFDANSNVLATAFTVTMATTPRVCNDFTASGLDGTMTLAGTSIGLTVSGSLTFQATNFTRTYTGTTTFNTTTTGKTVTTNGVAFGGSVTFDGVGGSWTLGSALTTSATATTTLTNGTLDLQSYTLSTGLFSSSNSNTRTIAFGTGNIACTGTGTAWTTATATNLTTTGTPVVNVTSVGSTGITVNSGALSEANSISFNFTGGTYGLTFLSSALTTVKSLDFTGYAGTWQATSTATIYGNFKLSTGMTLTAVNPAMTFGATSGTQQITTNAKTLDFPITVNGVGGTVQLQDAMTLGTTRTFTLTNGTLDLNNLTLTTGLFQSSNSNTRTLAFGTGNIAATGTGIVFTSLATNLTVTGTPVANITSSGSTPITVSSGALSEAQAISFNFTGGTYALTFLSITSATAKNVDFTGFAGTLGAIGGNAIYGNLKLSTGMSLTAGASILTFGATSGTQQITTNAKTLDFPITLDGVGGTVQLQDALTMGSAKTVTLTNGTLDLNGKTLTVGTRFTTATGTKNLTFNGGTLVCPDPNTTSFNNAAPTGFTTTAGTGTGVISMTAATAKTFVGGSSTFNCTLQNSGAGALTVSGSNTFTTISNSVQPTTFTFTSGTTQTLTNWSVNGTAGNLVTIGASTTSAATLSKASGTVSSDYLSISYSIATGGASWYAGANSTNSGNNTGWIFTAPPSGAAATGNFLMFF